MRALKLAEIEKIERWNFASTAFSKPDRFATVRTYPDKGHASFDMVSLPLPTELLSPFPLQAGRWLTAAGAAANEVVFNQIARRQAPSLAVGQDVQLTIEGKDSLWRVVGMVEDIGTPAAMAYVTNPAFERVTESTGRSNSLRVAFSDRSAKTTRALAPEIEEILEKNGVRVVASVPTFELKSAIADHMRVLVSALIAIAILMASVGILGLASTMSVNIIERTRELGVMRAIGATPEKIRRLLLLEGLFTGALSLLLAVLLSLPLSGVIGRIIGSMAFAAPLHLSYAIS